MRALRPSVLVACVALCSGAFACEGAHVRVPVEPESGGAEDEDADDDNDETPVPCVDARGCRGEEGICHRGFCVECVVNEDCPREGQYCDLTEFECERGPQ